MTITLDDAAAGGSDPGSWAEAVLFPPFAAVPTGSAAHCRPGRYSPFVPARPALSHVQHHGAGHYGAPLIASPGNSGANSHGEAR